MREPIRIGKQEGKGNVMFTSCAECGSGWFFEGDTGSVNVVNVVNIFAGPRPAVAAEDEDYPLSPTTV